MRSWQRFRNRRGSLHMGMRIEEGCALIASVIANTNRDRKKQPEPFTVSDFMPHFDEAPASLETAMSEWN